MRIVLSLPAHWRADRRYAPLGNPQILAELSRQIARSLRPHSHLYRSIPPGVPVEIDWVPDDANPRLVEPILLIEIEGATTTPPRESVAQAGYRLSQGMADSHLMPLIPDCQIRLRVVSEHTAPIGG